MPNVVILIPAAGQSARMGGRDKLLETVGGMPLLRRQALEARATGAPVRVTLPPDRPGRRAALAGAPGLDIVELADAAEGMAASIRSGAGWAATRGARGLLVLPGDMPELGRDDLRKVMTMFETAPDAVWRASDATGRAGHPVILPARLFTRLARLRGDGGAKPVLRGERVCLVALPNRRATTDLDTPDAWAAWRSRTGP